MTCAKARVTCAIVTAEGYTFTGTNACRNPQRECPRIAAGETGRDQYRLCAEVCGQYGHAETEALRRAREWAVGATAYVSHHRVCDACLYQLHKAGIAKIVLGSQPA